MFIFLSIKLGAPMKLKKITLLSQEKAKLLEMSRSRTESYRTNKFISLKLFIKLLNTKNAVHLFA